MKKDIVLIINFNGQYSRIIARRIRELGVYCEIESYYNIYEKIKEKKPIAIVLSGGPYSVLKKDSPKIEKKIFELKIPILGICYGAQLIALNFKGEVISNNTAEFGATTTTFDTTSLLFKNIKKESQTLMSHNDSIISLPENFKIIANSKKTKIAAFENKEKYIYGVQFHPEVSNTDYGKNILENFLFNISNCKKNWKLDDFIENTINSIKEKVKNSKVLLALSGGVDSCVVAAILKKAIGKNLYAVFVDHGLLRKNEADMVISYFKNWNINFIFVDAKNIFLEKLKGVINPEEKRKIIGKTFIEVFENEAKKIKNIDFLAQGTIYPDIIESGENLNNKDIIKSHHNVGGIPKNIKFKEIIEPIKFLFKDEVKKIGKKLDLSDFLINRQPFPGPGLSIRIIGDITKEKLDILKEADYILRKEIEKLEFKPSQYFAVLSNTKSVGVMGDTRSYCYSLILRAVTTTDFMTAEVFELSYSVLKDISKKIINSVKGINRVLYDITSKPPATIEFE